MAASRTPVEARLPCMAPLARLPVFFRLHGRRVVIAGGSAAAAWKAELLSAAGASVVVFAEDPSDELLAVVANAPGEAVKVHRRRYAGGDIVGSTLAIGAFDNDEDSAQFASAARAAGVPVNVVDRPDFCDFSFGAIVNRSPLVIGISTDGAAPVFAQAVRARIEAMIPVGFARWAEAAKRWREAVKRSGLSFPARRRFWQVFTAQAVRHPGQMPTETDLATLLGQVRAEGAAAEQGSVTLVGAGPGDPELLTLRAVRALQSADVILFDDLVAAEILDFARREAKKMLVGKTGHGPSCKQDDINALMVALAESGKRVVRLKGGDPLIFGRAAEELEICRAAGMAVEVVPGITAAQGAASRLGVSLTSRSGAQRVQFVTAHGKDGGLPIDIDWRSLADPAVTTAVYMPAKTLGALVSNAVAHGLDPATPAVAISNATRQDEGFTADAIARLPGRIVDAPPGPMLVLIGHVLAEGGVVQRAVCAA